MKFLNKSSILKNLFPEVVLILLLLMFSANSASAHVSPAGCSGSGLGISLFTNVAQANIGDTISYSVTVFNGSTSGLVVCDATNIQASLVTPDGISHSVTLTRTSLSNGELDFYPNIVTYVARSQDITSSGTLAATASDTGVIHQNITDSQGGGNQGVNVFVLNTFHVIKQVVNNNGGTATASSFTVHIKKAGVDVAGSPAPGTASPGTFYSLIAGTYNVSEDPNALYTTSFSGDCDASGNVTLLGSENKTCTIINHDIPPVPATLHVIKQVINNSGGTATVSGFTLHVKSAGVDVAGSPMTGTVAPGTSYTLPAGTYAVSEDANVLYTKNFSGDCDASGNVTLLPSDNKTCTITNTDIAPIIVPPNPASINVVKTVINDNGGTKTTADFPLFVNGASVVSGVTNVFPAGAYTITETSDSAYTPSFSGDCDATGHLNIVPGDHKICVITNDDIAPGGLGHIITQTPIPPLIDVVKVPTPLALPNGPGQVTYTYTVKNIGTVPVTDVTMVGDSCSPITLLSGDTNNDSKLDVSEIWIYSCITNLSATHTNTVVATGWANGISAVDVASATVVVGAPGLPSAGTGGGGGVVPPLIHVTKVPTPLALPIGGGFVTYTEVVTNPGIVPLTNVHLTDDKCGPVNYISGDRNNDSRLDPSEAWVYTCRTRITRTTTNTVVAEGFANGITVRDFAIATVVVSTIKLPNTGIPGLPNTGYPPRENGESLNNIIIFAAIITLVSALLVIILKKNELPR